MIALAMAISSEVNLKIIEVTDIHPCVRIMGFFSEMACDVRNVLER